MTNLKKIKCHVIIPAAGSGTRFHGDKPKQYMKIGKKTILEHSANPFIRSGRISSITVAIPKNDHYASSLSGLRSEIVRFVEGGETRAHSVLNAIESLKNFCTPSDWILVHDAARPCLSIEDLENLLNHIDITTNNHGVILAKPATDTLKLVSENLIHETLAREKIWHALTPQAYPFQLLDFALRHSVDSGITITDEASAIEYTGRHPVVLQGNPRNIKVTYPEDMELAEFYLSNRFLR